MNTDTFTDFLEHRLDAADAYVTGDSDPVNAMTSQGESATFYGPDGSTIQGGPSVIEAFTQGAGHFDSASTSRIEMLQHGHSDNLAFWTGLQHAEAEMKADGRKVPMKLHVTEVFRREEDGWKLIHRHADMAKG